MIEETRGASDDGSSRLAEALVQLDEARFAGEGTPTDVAASLDPSLRRAFEDAGLPLRLAFTARDADLIRTYVGAGLGVGVLAEMALDPADRDVVGLPIDGLLPTCTTWIVLRRDRVLREYALEFVARLAPHLDRRDVRRAFDHGIAVDEWPVPPRWRDLDPARLAA